MVFTVIVLTNNEEFVTFLDPNFIYINEEESDTEIGRINVEYTMNDVTEAETLFRMGNKLLILNDTNLKDALYVINTKVVRDYYKENKVSFSAEDKIVELNNIIFSQTELTAANGFTLTTINNESNVLINYNALSYWFGRYFNIGVVQKCLTERLQKIVVTGTFTGMELLRYIEEETGNRFRTRYEKDVKTNIIHPYLDFLNPVNNSKKWELNIDYTFYEDEDNSPIDLEDEDGNIIDEGTIIDEETDVLEEDDIVIFPQYTPNTNLNPANTQFELYNGKAIVGTWNAAEVGLTTENNNCIIRLEYENNTVKITINGKTFNPSNGTGDSNNAFVVNEGTAHTFNNIPLGNETVFKIIDATNNEVAYEQHIKPLLGNVHEEVLDLGFNTENIEYEIDEEDTYNAIAPILSLDNTDLTRNQLNTVITRWINLEVTKGDIVPMIVQKINNEGTLSGYNLSSKYYSRPLKPNDQETTKEYFVATAYWAAPFTKHSGSLYIEDDNDTGIEYDSITTRRDDYDERGVDHSPKIGTVETSEENVYAIYNDVCMKLREKRFPKVNLEVDVANLKDNNFNAYNLYDKVYIKVPGFNQLISSTVTKTNKTIHDIGENTIELNNDVVITKEIPSECEILADNVSFKYPSKKDIKIKLVDGDNTPLSNKLLSVNVNKIENESSTPTRTVYNRKTNANGEISLTLKYDPGDYELVINFGGDVEYSATTTTIDVNVSGAKEVQKTTSSKTKTKTKTKTQYYTKYGVSPSKKYLMAIGKASATGEDSKYGANTFYRTIFTRKCPKCGSIELYWSIYWGAKETSTSGKFPPTGKTENKADKGKIVCKKCGARYSVIGNSLDGNGKTLKVYNGPYKTKKTEAYTLKKGKKPYNAVKKSVKTKKLTGNTGTPKYAVDSKVQKQAKKIVGNSTGIAAAKKIAKWCAKHIRWQSGYEGFRKSPRSVLNSKKGNCCDQTRLMLMMMDAVGVTQEHKLIYMHVHGGKGGHVFAKINGKYVDPCKTSNPWGHYVTGYGKPGSARNSVYPTRPF